MPSKFCSGNICCDNHGRKKSKENVSPECKDFVIIGNGPSGIVLSYMLSGHWPYYTGLQAQTQDEFLYLHARLMEEPGLSLVQRDLQFLSMGLEGRSNYPVALLMDTLQKPEADLGLESESLLEWKHHPEKSFDHVVLGRGHPGGIWQSIDGDLLTVSLGGWMELPAMSMSDWRDQQQERGAELTGRASVATVSQYYQDYVKKMGLEQNFRNYSVVTGVRQIRCKELNKDDNTVVESNDDEIQREEVFSFDNDEDLDDLSSACSSLTRRRSLSSNSFESTAMYSGPSPSQVPASQPNIADIDPRFSSFCRQDSSVSNWDPIINPSLFGQSYLQPSHSLDVPGPGSLEDMEQYCHSLKCSMVRRCCPEADTLFEVTGYQQRPGDTEPSLFSYLTKNVVLATGAADRSNSLNVSGESRPFVLHTLSQLNTKIKTGDLTPHSQPVLIVGAGLSAADAVLAAQSHHIPSVHSFRKQARDPGLVFTRLPSKLYPEYHTVHKMMAGDTPCEGYSPLQQSEISNISEDKIVTLKREDGEELMIKVSYVLVLIGSMANLSFLGDTADKLGLTPGLEISKNNPVDIDVFTHQCTAVPGLFAMGPLIGDNFVRFIQGGALAITNYAQQTRDKRNADMLDCC